MEEFKERIESLRKRLISKIQVMSSNIDGFVDSRNDLYDVKHLIQVYRKSMEKCNLYLSEMEVIVEERIKDESQRNIGVFGKFVKASARDTNK